MVHLKPDGNRGRYGFSGSPTLQAQALNKDDT